MSARAGHLRIIEVRNGLDAMRKSLKTHERYGGNPWRFVLIAGHGWEELQAISFAVVPTDHPTAHYPGGLRKEHLSGRGVRRMSEWLAPKAEIILLSCDVGKPGNLAETMSKELNRTVLAADGTIDYHKLSVENVSDDGTPSFSVRFFDMARSPVRSNKFDPTESRKNF